MIDFCFMKKGCTEIELNIPPPKKKKKIQMKINYKICTKFSENVKRYIEIFALKLNTNKINIERFTGFMFKYFFTVHAAVKIKYYFRF